MHTTHFVGILVEIIVKKSNNSHVKTVKRKERAEALNTSEL